MFDVTQFKKFSTSFKVADSGREMKSLGKEIKNDCPERDFINGSVVPSRKCLRPTQVRVGQSSMVYAHDCCEKRVRLARQ